MRATMALDYLDFDFSGDADGGGSFDAMACVAPGQLAVLEAEVLRVLDWAERSFGPAAALDEGGEWDFALHGVREVATPLVVRCARRRPAAVGPGAADPPRVTLTLTLSGTEPFCDAFRAAFAVG